MDEIRKVYPSLFTLDEAYDFGIETANDLARNMNGQLGCFPNDMGILAQCIKNAGDGDYLEIGTYYGATAILASLTKKEFGLRGKVHAIDDLVFESRSAADIMNNIEKFGADVRLKVSKSNPFPMPGHYFSCVFIDAGHDFYNCWTDWLNVRRRTSKYVIFHDYDLKHREVMEVVNRADFYPVRISDNTAVLELIV